MGTSPKGWRGDSAQPIDAIHLGPVWSLSQTELTHALRHTLPGGGSDDPHFTAVDDGPVALPASEPALGVPATQSRPTHYSHCQQGHRYQEVRNR